MNYPSPQWAQWVADLEHVGNAVTALHGKRAIWRTYQEHLARGMKSEEDGPFHDWIVRNYVESVTIGVRRQVDEDKRVRSLARVLRSLETHSHEITLTAFESLWVDAPHIADIAPQEFARITTHKTALPSSVPRDDRLKLRKGIGKLERWVNTRVAHSSAHNVDSDGLTFAELDAAVDLVGDVLHKYHLLLTAASMLKWEPTYAQFYENAIARLFGRDR